MVKNKTLPDSARLCQNLQTPLSGHSLSLSLSFSLSLSLADLALLRLVSHLSLANTVHPEGIPWILPRLDPGNFYCPYHIFSVSHPRSIC